ncbi:Haem-binding domain-containing protein [Hydrobacter penzbergensis]|uniref:Haem-binding domain-containing protein n=1 Tax=Hydrobacter penzbergensis TaxID=1235997 RepID=A0A8X8ICQ9_9BACT|nr:heme-binding domain-containing protein [Hydrobacter penzbergensis]SDW14451.1 Haem-binding domain-containing protein [Hydrobacter penzbergensis]
MSRTKKILLAILIVLIVIQFIQPTRNTSGQVLQTDIVNMYNVPQSIQAVFENACYDCHSNNTRYPWYANVQPMGWLLARHVKEGKDELNFSEFGSYSSRRQANKLRAIENSVKDGTMPLSSYLLLHKDARLTETYKAEIISWVRRTRDSLTQNK